MLSENKYFWNAPVHSCLFWSSTTKQFEERNTLPSKIDKNEQMFLCESTNVSSDWPHHLKQPENELMIKLEQKAK